MCRKHNMIWEEDKKRTIVVIAGKWNKWHRKTLQLLFKVTEQRKILFLCVNFHEIYVKNDWHTQNSIISRKFTFFWRNFTANLRRFRCIRSPCSKAGPVGSWFSKTSSSCEDRVWSSKAVAKSWHCLRNSWYSFCEWEILVSMKFLKFCGVSTHFKFVFQET